MNAAQIAQEYLVKLGVQLDEKNLNKLLNFLESGKVKAAALSGAMIAAGTVIYKFIKATTQAEMSLANLARQQGKSVEQTRAQQNALKAMNATAQDVAKDPALKTIYEDLQKINKEMALPDMKNVLGTVRSLQKEFYALRSTVQYGLQWINYYLLQQLKEPIEQIGKWFKQAREWLRVNMKQVSRDIANYMSAFGKGLVGILDTAKRIFEWVGRLPDGVKAIGAAVIGLTALIKSGPLGQLLMLVEAIGGLYQDYDNYKFNVAHPEIPEEQKVDIAFPGVWEVLESDLSSSDKAKEIIGMITGKISEVAGDFGSNLLTWVTEHKEEISAAGTEIADFLATGIRATGELLGALLQAFNSVIGDPKFKKGVSEALRTTFRTVFANLNYVGGILADGIAQALSGMSPEDWKKEFGDSDDNPIMGALGTYLLGRIFGADPKVSLLGAIGSFFGAQMTDAEIEGAITDNAGSEENSGLYTAGRTAANKLITAFKGFLKTRFNAISSFVNIIGPAITGITQEDWEQSFGEHNTAMNGLVAALFAKASGADLNSSIITGVVASITDAFNTTEGEEGVAGALSTYASDLMPIGKGILDIIGDGLNSFKTWWEGPDGQAFQTDIAEAGKWVADKLFGSEDEQGNRTGGLWDSFVEILTSITKAVTESELWQTITDKIKGAVKAAAEGLWNLVRPYVLNLWSNIVSHMPKYLKDWLQIKDVITFNKDKNGIVTAETSAHEGEYRFQDAKSGDRTLSETLMDYADILSVTEDGQLGIDQAYVDVIGDLVDMASSKLQEAIAVGNVDYVNDLLEHTSSAIKAGHGSDSYAKLLMQDVIPEEYRDALKWFEEEHSYINDSAEYMNEDGTPNEAANRLSDAYNGMFGMTAYEKAKAAYDYRYPEKEKVTEPIEEGIEEADKTVHLEVDTEELTNDIDNAVRNYRKKGPTAKTGGNVAVFSSGGRIGSRMDDVTVGEDGTEYIIPITKPGRAVQLITQMLGEMGRGVTGQILNAIGIGSDLSSVSSAMTNYADMLSGKGTSVVYNNNVSAPVTISVQAAASSAAETGMYLYNLTQRSLLRSVQGVLAS